MDLRDVEAVLLDMDGILVDSDAAVERAWTVWAGEHGLPHLGGIRTWAGFVAAGDTMPAQIEGRVRCGLPQTR